MNRGLSTAFELAPKDQSRSRLMQLPVELRCKVLRLLLRYDRYLPLPLSYVQQSFDVDCNPAHWVDLSSQILSTSQALYHEAYCILYKENTIPVEFSRVGYTNVLYATVLYSTAYILEGHRWNCPNPLYSNRGTFDLSRFYRYDCRIFASALSLLTRFENIHVSFANVVNFLAVSRSLKSYVHNKHVTVDFAHSWPRYKGASCHTLLWAMSYPFQPEFAPAAFCIWHCKSIGFQNGCRAEDCINKCFSRYVPLAHDITNEDFQRRDLFPEWWRLNYAIFQIKATDLGGVPWTNVLDWIEGPDLLEAVYSSDVDRFENVRRQLLASVSRRLGNMGKSDRRKVEDGASREIEEVEEYLDSDDEERTIRIDYVVERKESLLATMKTQTSDLQRLLYELVDEDGLLND